MRLGSGGQESTKYKTRFQDIFVQFTLVNIGGVRAEDIELSMSGALKRQPPREDLGGAFRAPFPQFAPGQSHFLFMFEQHDLYDYPQGGGARTGLKTGSFTITVAYNSPRGVMNWILGLPNRLRGKKQFNTQYTFSAAFIEGDLPPPEYAS